MICGNFTMSGIPNGQQDAIYNGFATNDPPPTSVTKTQNKNGTWTVMTKWPPCPAGTVTTHSAGLTPTG
jgi:hypothetical protein